MLADPSLDALKCGGLCLSGNAYIVLAIDPSLVYDVIPVVHVVSLLHCVIILPKDQNVNRNLRFFLCVAFWQHFGLSLGTVTQGLYHILGLICDRGYPIGVPHILVGVRGILHLTVQTGPHALGVPIFAAQGWHHHRYI